MPRAEARTSAVFPTPASPVDEREAAAPGGGVGQAAPSASGAPRARAAAVRPQLTRHVASSRVAPAAPSPGYDRASERRSVDGDRREQRGARRRIVEDAKQYVLHSWSVQNAINPIPVAGAEGRYFWDYDGNRYLDFASQLVNVSIGHQHPKVVAAIKEQADRLCTIGPPMAHESRSRARRGCSRRSRPATSAMSFFTNGGAEANENAIKLARWYTGRHKVVARYRSYHGATAGAITLTGDPRRWPAEPGIPGVVRMLDPYTYRCPAGHPDPCPVCSGAPHLEEILQYEGPQTVAAVILETVVGTNGSSSRPTATSSRSARSATGTGSC